MKVRSEREKTKVVIRHLSPSLTLSDFFPTHRFSLRFSLQLVLLPSRQQQVITIQTLPVCSLCNPNKSLIIIIICSHKRQMHSRAYIDFKCPDDVFEFTEFFDGHVFVNERGAQYKVIVEYAPSQRVPKPSAKKMDVKGLYSKVDVMLI
ncbi:Regulator of nonsense transcripts 3A [Glycine soja]|uniref:Regulator of nonsense transcripts 3A n=2 Tax=Glycine soja TaxID=3848 RepID=A0A0B2QR48_GLYSO|nr:Regulator of nonsense transcripts 3A [Glycine soja]